MRLRIFMYKQAVLDQYRDRATVSQRLIKKPVQICILNLCGSRQWYQLY